MGRDAFLDQANEEIDGVTLDTKSFTFIEVADALDDFFCSEGNWGGADMRARLWEVGKGWFVWETRRMESLTNSYVFIGEGIKGVCA